MLYWSLVSHMEWLQCCKNLLSGKLTMMVVNQYSTYQPGLLILTIHWIKASKLLKMRQKMRWLSLSTLLSPEEIMVFSLYCFLDQLGAPLRLIWSCWQGWIAPAFKGECPIHLIKFSFLKSIFATLAREWPLQLVVWFFLCASFLE